MLEIRVTTVNNNKLHITDGNKTMIVTREQLDSQVKAGNVKVNCIKVQCLDKQRDKNNIIVAYTLKDSTGKQMQVAAKSLKDAIYNYRVECSNLTLTSDNRLVDTTEKANNFEDKCMYIIEYMNKNTLAKFNKDKVKFSEFHDFEATSEVFAEQNLRTTITINKSKYNKLQIAISIGNEDADIDEVYWDEEEFFNDIKEYIEHIANISKMKSPKDILDLAVRMSIINSEAEEIVMPALIEELEEKSNISVHDEVQRRINKILDNNAEIQRIKNIIISTYDNRYELSQHSFNNYIKASVLYEALFSTKVVDFSTPLMLYNENTDYVNKFNIDIKEGINYTGNKSFTTWILR